MKNGLLTLVALLLGGIGTTQAQTVVEYIHTDALGSVVAVTDANRNVLERREYEPYGAQLTPAVHDGPGYTGHVQDTATGLVQMHQRYYDPSLGRFLSVDPVSADPNNGALFNRYMYAANNPYRFFDPDGRCTGSRIENSGGTCKSTGGHTTMSTSAVPEASQGSVQQFNASAPSSSGSGGSGRNWFTGQGSLTDFEALTDAVIPPLLNSPE
jgi:RHS repeat-associated protein